eukprot:12533087-Ditylum_brightwellii.AAC.1
MDRQDGRMQLPSICGHTPLEWQLIWAILFLICQMDCVPYPDCKIDRHTPSGIAELDETGLTSLQLHVQYNDFFESVRPGMNNPLTTSLWQIKSGLRAAQVSRADPFKRAGQSRPSRAAISKRRDEESPKSVEQQQELSPETPEILEIPDKLVQFPQHTTDEN